MTNQKPPVPKFNLQKLDNVNSDYRKPTEKSDKRRFREVVTQIEKVIPKLEIPELKDLIQNLSIKMITVPLLESMKSKKYSSIANALIIHSTRILLLPFTMKQLMSILDANQKQVRKILNELAILYPFNRNEYVLSFVSKLCMQLGFTFKFQYVCSIIYDILNQFDLIQGEHEHIISAAVVKLAGDVVFAQRGGIMLSVISLTAGCCEVSLKNFLKKVEPNFPKMAEIIVQHFQIHKL